MVLKGNTLKINKRLFQHDTWHEIGILKEAKMTETQERNENKNKRLLKWFSRTLKIYFKVPLLKILDKRLDHNIGTNYQKWWMKMKTLEAGYIKLHGIKFYQ